MSTAPFYIHDLVDSPPWMAAGLCAQTDPDAFFPEKGGSTREAKRVCGTCPVTTDCLTYALEHQERFGIWGGKSERERRKLSGPRIPISSATVARHPGAGRAGAAAALKAELDALGVTSRQVKDWAMSTGLLHELGAGPVAAHVVDAYAAAHPEGEIA